MKVSSKKGAFHRCRISYCWFSLKFIKKKRPLLQETMYARIVPVLYEEKIYKALIYYTRSVSKLSLFNLSLTSTYTRRCFTTFMFVSCGSWLLARSSRLPPPVSRPRTPASCLPPHDSTLQRLEKKRLFLHNASSLIRCSY